MLENSSCGDLVRRRPCPNFQFTDKCMVYAFDSGNSSHIRGHVHAGYTRTRQVFCVPGMYLHLGVRVRGVYQRTGMRVPRLYLSTLPRRNDMVHGRGEQRRPRQVPQAWARPIVNRDYSCDLKIRLFARLLVEIVAPCETRRIHSCRGVGRVLNNSDIFLFLVD